MALHTYLRLLQVVAKHDAPVRHCFFVKQLGTGMLVTGGWDKTVGLAVLVPNLMLSSIHICTSAQH